MFNVDMFDVFEDVFDEVEVDGVWVVVFIGVGDEVFIVGVDIGYMKDIGMFVV